MCSLIYLSSAALRDWFDQAIELALHQVRELAVMFMYLDRFKHINYSLGHVIGDQLLPSVAQRLVGCVGHSDILRCQLMDAYGQIG